MDCPERMIFIVGTGRSGTNLLQAMLNGHPSIRVATETHFIPTLIRKFGKKKINVDAFCQVIADHWTSDGTRRWIEFHLDDGGHSTESFTRDFAHFCSPKDRGTVSQLVNAFFRFCYGSWPIMGDKTPQYGLHMEKIHEHWPEAKFIHMVRDGRYAAGSMQKHDGFVRLINAGYPDEIGEYSYKGKLSSYSTEGVTLEECVEYWETTIRMIKLQSKKIPSSKYIEVKYEHLIEKPISELIRISKFIGVNSLSPKYIGRAALPKPFKVMKDEDNIEKKDFKKMTREGGDTLRSLEYPVNYHKIKRINFYKWSRAYIQWVFHKISQ